MKYKVCWSRTDKGLRPYLQYLCAEHRIKAFEVFFDSFEEARNFALIELAMEVFEPISHSDRNFTIEELNRPSSVAIINTESGEEKDSFGYLLIPQDKLFNL